MTEISIVNCVYYLKNEFWFGCNLYYSGWKKLLLHPWQTVKDFTYAVRHPIETGKNFLDQTYQHPIGMTVNFCLSWVTGRAISTGIESLESLVPGIEGAADSEILSQAQNTTTIHTGSVIPSVFSQAGLLGQKPPKFRLAS